MKKRFLKISILVFSSVLLTLLLGELVAKVYFSISPPPLGKFESREKQPPPYQNTSYFSATFMEERKKVPSGITTLKENDLLILHDLEYKFFTIKNGQRRTTDQPENFKHRILLFGGSTVFSTDVPDQYTLPSYLQRLLNQNFPNQYRVENFGVMSVRAYQELELLKLVGVNEGDIVIFFDGVNDILYVVYYKGLSQSVIQSANVTKKASQTPFEKTILSLIDKFKEHSDALKFLYYFSKKTYPNHIKEKTELDKFVAHAENEYIKIIQKAYKYTESFGARFVHILQPNIYTRNKHSTYEQSVVKNYLTVPPGAEVAFQNGNKSFREGLKNLQNQGIKSVDFSDVFNSKPENDEYYLDFVHVNHLGNEIWATEIYKTIKDDLVAVKDVSKGESKFTGIPEHLLKKVKTAPQLVKSLEHKKINIVAFDGKFYGIPWDLGPVDLAQTDVSGLSGVVVAHSVKDIESLILQNSEDSKN